MFRIIVVHSSFSTNKKQPTFFQAGCKYRVIQFEDKLLSLQIYLFWHFDTNGLALLVTNYGRTVFLNVRQPAPSCQVAPLLDLGHGDHLYVSSPPFLPLLKPPLIPDFRKKSKKRWNPKKSDAPLLEPGHGDHLYVSSTVVSSSSFKSSINSGSPAGQEYCANCGNQRPLQDDGWYFCITRRHFFMILGSCYNADLIHRT